jgi:Tol biopolymer transport system component
MKKFFWGTATVVLLVLLGGCASLLALIGGKQEEEEPVIDVASFTNGMLMKNIVKITDDELQKNNVVVSPDGTKVLYCETKTAVQDGQTRVLSDIILLRNLPSSAKTSLGTNGNAFTPGWTANNTNFLYGLFDNGAYRIVRSTISGGGRTNLTRTPIGGHDGNPASSQNGVILIDTLQGSSWAIHSMTENGAEQTRVVDGREPSWHPIDRRFLYIKANSSTGALCIWEYDMDDQLESLLYEDPNRFNCRYPTYSSNGKYIVFQKGAEQMVNGVLVTTTTSATGKKSSKRTNTVERETRWQLFFMDREYLNISELTSGNVDCQYPTLDQSDRLYFISNAAGLRSNKTEIYRADLMFDE